jgi:hypothetical protein
VGVRPPAQVRAGVRSAERIPGAAALQSRIPPEPYRLLPLPARGEDIPQLPERLPDTFVGLLWWKLKTRL